MSMVTVNINDRLTSRGEWTMCEDVKLMAEFMGHSLHENNRVVTYINDICQTCGDNKSNHAPDYPNDMNALLGVLDKLKADHGIGWEKLDGTVLIGGEMVGGYSVLVTNSNASLFWNSCQTKNTALPQALFPLLVEAIKQAN